MTAGFAVGPAVDVESVVERTVAAVAAVGAVVVFPLGLAVDLVREVHWQLVDPGLQTVEV